MTQSSASQEGASRQMLLAAESQHHVKRSRHSKLRSIIDRTICCAPTAVTGKNTSFNFS